MSVSLLLVDDSHITRRVTKKLLLGIFDGRGKEVSITEVADGNEALSLCRASTVDLMFLDLTMPGMSGYEVMEVLKSEGVKTKVVVLTADVQAGAEALSKELGAIAFVKKPFDKQTIVDVLQEHGLI